MPTTPSRSVALDRSPAAIKVDNLLRQQLKISDPYDPAQIAEGLRKHYVADAGLEERERQGLPAIRAPLAPVAATSTGPISLETDQGLDDLEQDLRAILQESQLKDVRAELQGWARAIRAAASDGLSAARLARDPSQRDRAFWARRTLADYARLSRYVGALSGGINSLYRRLAQSCDVVASLILVCCGEGLAAVGVVRSSFILQAPVSELQTRRDAVLAALRNLIGSTQYAYGPNEWPRGLEAYRRLMTRLDESGQSDLRALFNEANLGRLFDELIDMAAGSSPDGLRALGATAMVSLQRVNRLIAFANRGAFQNISVTGAVTPESPPLATFLSALRLFVEAFESANRGYRLVYIARPPILTYGLYGQVGIDDATRRLLNLILLRNRFAEEIDCLMRCRCDEDTVRAQLRLDKILFDLDRAIDYYALSAGTLDETGEIRSLAYGAVIAAFGAPLPPPNIQLTLDALAEVLGWDDDIPDLVEELDEILGNANEVNQAAAADAVVDAPPADATWEEIVEAAAEAAAGFAPLGLEDAVEEEAAETIRRRRLYGELLHQELCLQHSGELQWERLVRALAPSCIAPSMIPIHDDSVVVAMLERAHVLVRDHTLVTYHIGEPCPPIEVTIPPHHETSLDSIADNIDRDGFGRP